MKDNVHNISPIYNFFNILVMSIFMFSNSVPTEFSLIQEVDEKRYLDEIGSSGLCLNFENFFIFQGNVETFVRMKPKNFTSVIEDLCG